VTFEGLEVPRGGQTGGDSERRDGDIVDVVHAAVCVIRGSSTPNVSYSLAADHRLRHLEPNAVGAAGQPRGDRSSGTSPSPHDQTRVRKSFRDLAKSLGDDLMAVVIDRAQGRRRPG
jgi:hypothetical protein